MASFPNETVFVIIMFRCVEVQLEGGGGIRKWGWQEVGMAGSAMGVWLENLLCLPFCGNPSC